MEIGHVDPQNDANPHTKREDDRKDLGNIIHKQLSFYSYNIQTLTAENKCEESKVVCQSAYLTVGSLLYAMCAPNKDKLAVEFKPETEQKICPRQLKEKWVEVGICHTHIFACYNQTNNTYK
jgi:hypothetical protein